jgi:hypothetical protein
MRLQTATELGLSTLQIGSTGLDVDLHRQRAPAWRDARHALDRPVMPTLVRSDGAQLGGLVDHDTLRRFFTPVSIR